MGELFSDPIVLIDLFVLLRVDLFVQLFDSSDLLNSLDSLVLPFGSYSFDSFDLIVTFDSFVLFVLPFGALVFQSFDWQLLAGEFVQSGPLSAETLG